MKRKYHTFSIPCKEGERILLSFVRFFWETPGVLEMANWEKQTAMMAVLDSANSVTEMRQCAYISLCDEDSYINVQEQLSAAIEAECEVVSFAVLHANASFDEYVTTVRKSMYPHRKAITNGLCSLIVSYVINGTDVFIAYDAEVHSQANLMEICK